MKDDPMDEIEIKEEWAGLPSKGKNPVLVNLQENKGLLKFCVFAFALGAIMGFMFHAESAETLRPAIDSIAGIVEAESNDLDLAKAIFLNNARASLLMVALGVTLFLPALILFFNGYLVGFVLGEFAENPLLFLAGTLPHGVFELPALFIASSLGIRIGLCFFFPEKNRVLETSKAIREAGGVYLTVVLPLLLLAAAIESFVSKALLAALMSFI